MRKTPKRPKKLLAKVVKVPFNYYLFFEILGFFRKMDKNGKKFGILPEIGTPDARTRLKVPEMERAQ